MPLFFLLSGFCLTLTYGKKNYKKSTLCSGNFPIFSACDHELCHKQSDLYIFGDTRHCHLRHPSVPKKKLHFYLYKLILRQFKVKFRATQYTHQVSRSSDVSQVHRLLYHSYILLEPDLKLNILVQKSF